METQNADDGFESSGDYADYPGSEGLTEDSLSTVDSSDVDFDDPSSDGDDDGEVDDDDEGNHSGGGGEDGRCDGGTKKDGGESDRPTAQPPDQSISIEQTMVKPEPPAATQNAIDEKCVGSLDDSTSAPNEQKKLTKPLKWKPAFLLRDSDHLSSTSSDVNSTEFHSITSDEHEDHSLAYEDPPEESSITGTDELAKDIVTPVPIDPTNPLSTDGNDTIDAVKAKEPELKQSPNKKRKGKKSPKNKSLKEEPRAAAVSYLDNRPEPVGTMESMGDGEPTERYCSLCTMEKRAIETEKESYYKMCCTNLKKPCILHVHQKCFEAFMKKQQYKKKSDWRNAPCPTPSCTDLLKEIHVRTKQDQKFTMYFICYKMEEKKIADDVLPAVPLIVPATTMNKAKGGAGGLRMRSVSHAVSTEETGSSVATGNSVESGDCESLSRSCSSPPATWTSNIDEMVAAFEPDDGEHYYEPLPLDAEVTPLIRDNDSFEAKYCSMDPPPITDTAAARKKKKRQQELVEQQKTVARLVTQAKAITTPSSSPGKRTKTKRPSADYGKPSAVTTNGHRNVDGHRSVDYEDSMVTPFDIGEFPKPANDEDLKIENILPKMKTIFGEFCLNYPDRLTKMDTLMQFIDLQEMDAACRSDYEDLVKRMFFKKLLEQSKMFEFSGKDLVYKAGSDVDGLNLFTEDVDLAVRQKPAMETLPMPSSPRAPMASSSTSSSSTSSSAASSSAASTSTHSMPMAIPKRASFQAGAFIPRMAVTPPPPPPPQPQNPAAAFAGFPGFYSPSTPPEFMLVNLLQGIRHPPPPQPLRSCSIEALYTPMDDASAPYPAGMIPTPQPQPQPQPVFTGPSMVHPNFAPPPDFNTQQSQFYPHARLFADNDRLQQTVAEQERSLAQFRTENHQCQMTIIEKTREITKLSERMKTRDADLAAVKRELEKVKDELQMSQKSGGFLKAKAEKLESAEQKWKEKAEDCVKSENELKRKLAEMEREMQMAEVNRVELFKQMEEMQKRLGETSGQVDEVVQQQMKKYQSELLFLRRHTLKMYAERQIDKSTSAMIHVESILKKLPEGQDKMQWEMNLISWQNIHRTYAMWSKMVDSFMDRQVDEWQNGATSFDELEILQRPTPPMPPEIPVTSRKVENQTTAIAMNNLKMPLTVTVPPSGVSAFAPPPAIPPPRVNPPPQPAVSSKILQAAAQMRMPLVQNSDGGGLMMSSSPPKTALEPLDVMLPPPGFPLISPRQPSGASSPTFSRSTSSMASRESNGGQSGQSRPVEQAGNNVFGESQSGQSRPVEQAGNNICGENISNGQSGQSRPVEQAGNNIFGESQSGQSRPIEQAGNNVFDENMAVAMSTQKRKVLQKVQQQIPGVTDQEFLCEHDKMDRELTDEMRRQMPKLSHVAEYLAARLLENRPPQPSADLSAVTTTKTLPSSSAFQPTASASIPPLSMFKPPSNSTAAGRPLPPVFAEKAKGNGSFPPSPPVFAEKAKGNGGFPPSVLPYNQYGNAPSRPTFPMKAAVKPMGGTTNGFGTKSGTAVPPWYSAISEPVKQRNVDFDGHDGCKICLEKLIPHTEIMKCPSVSCSEPYHSECIGRWMRQTDADHRCPNCNRYWTDNENFPSL